MFGGGYAIPDAMAPMSDSSLHSGMMAAKRPRADSGPSVGLYPKLKGAIRGRVVMCFSAPPTGYMDALGVKKLVDVSHYARQYNGRVHIRVQDVGVPEDQLQSSPALLDDVASSGFQYEHVTYLTGQLDRCRQLAERLIMSNKAYVSGPSHVTGPEVPPRKAAPKVGVIQSGGKAVALHEAASVAAVNGSDPAVDAHRPQSTEENLRLFRAMLEGAGDGVCCTVRVKMDQHAASNDTPVDPVLYAPLTAEQCCSGTRHKAGPSALFADAVVDSLSGVTHTLMDGGDERAVEAYQWIQKALGLRSVHVHVVGPITCPASMRVSAAGHGALIKRGLACGWNDARLPTVAGLLRRGLSPEGMRAYLLSLGAGSKPMSMTWEGLWSANRKYLDCRAPRFMAIPKSQCVEVSVSGVPEGLLATTVPLHPRDPSLGSRTLYTSDTVLLDASDAEEATVGEEVTLLRWTSVLVTAIDRSDAKVNRISCEYLPKFEFKKKKRAVTWLVDCADLVPIKLLEFGPLLTKDALEEGEDMCDFFNHKSRCVVDALGDPELRKLHEGCVLQLERRGFFRVERPYVSPRDPMVLILIPDGKHKKTLPPVLQAAEVC